MSNEVVKELFRNLENVLHDRLKVIEDIIDLTKNQNQNQNQSSNAVDATISAKLAELESHYNSLDDYTMSQVRTLAFNHDQLENTVKHLEARLASLESSMRSAAESFSTINGTIEMMQKRLDAPVVRPDETPVEVAEVEAEMEEAQEAEDADNEESPEEEAEAEEEESPYDHIFTFENVDYYVDRNTNNVYNPDEDGGVDPDDVKGVWNPATEKMWIPLKKKWWDYKTNKYTEPKAKK